MNNLELAFVEMLLALRAEYLRSGGNVLKHWDQIQDRARAAARQSETISQWATATSRSLQLGSPSKRRSLATEVLVKSAGGEDIAALDHFEDNHGFIMAAARLTAERSKHQEKEEKAHVHAAV